MIKVKKKLALLTVAVIILAVLFLWSFTDSFLFSENLTVSQPEHSTNFGEVYVVNLNRAEMKVGCIYLRVEPPIESSGNTATYRALLQFAHSETLSEIDSISFKLTSQQIQLYMGINYQNLKPTLNRNGAEQTITISDFGSLGGGSIDIEFLLQAPNTPISFQVEADLSMHQEQLLPLTSLKAHTSFNAQLPKTDSS